MHLITLKAKANEGWEDGQQITILKLEGDPLNLETSGAFDLDIVIQIPSNQIQKSCSDEEIRRMSDDAGVAERKHEHAAKHNIKWDHLSCVLNLIPCTGPDCNIYLGTTYVECLHAKKRS
jgi:hypothetical protein